MQFTFLGTSSGTPTTTRNVSGLALRADQSSLWYLVDCGEGTQHRLLSTPLSLANLAAIFITHIHGDHCYGLPGLLASAGMLNRSERLYLVGPAGVADFVQGVMGSTQLRLPYPVEFIEASAFPAGLVLPDFEVRTTALSHRVPSYAYSFSETGLPARLDGARLERDGVPAGPLRAELQAGRDAVLPDGRKVAAADYLLPPRRPRKVIVGGDNDNPALLAWEAQGADVLIHEATYTEAVLTKVGPGPQHSSARKVAQFAADARVPNLVLTHFSPRYQDGREGGLSLADIEAEARQAYPGRLFLAQDLERYLLDRQGILTREG